MHLALIIWFIMVTLKINVSGKIDTNLTRQIKIITWISFLAINPVLWIYGWISTYYYKQIGKREFV
ncbi:hypothetical protein SALLE_v1c10220 [Spiroplasma alleghenense]|uniref:Uncharacterized protein n=1 Tax=Spiroplasma alleghenense TaxID=216931 RepID=A0A345Z513_9MOLU|nr:hypothetical protein SALLE_v1c10220 [Spiroplasma alleghenense]